MPQINANTLIVVIQSLDRSIADLIKARDDGTADLEECADLDDLILSHQKAALELREAYAEAQRDDPNLPRYGSLVRGDFAGPPPGPA